MAAELRIMQERHAGARDPANEKTLAQLAECQVQGGDRPRLDASDASTRKSLADQKVDPRQPEREVRVVRERMQETSTRIGTLARSSAVGTSVSTMSVRRRQPCDDTRSADPAATETCGAAPAPPAPASLRASRRGASTTRRGSTTPRATCTMAVSGFERFLSEYPKSDRPTMRSSTSARAT